MGEKRHIVAIPCSDGYYECNCKLLENISNLFRRVRAMWPMVQWFELYGIKSPRLTKNLFERMTDYANIQTNQSEKPNKEILHNLWANHFMDLSTSKMLDMFQTAIDLQIHTVKLLCAARVQEIILSMDHHQGTLLHCALRSNLVQYALDFMKKT